MGDAESEKSCVCFHNWFGVFCDTEVERWSFPGSYCSERLRNPGPNWDATLPTVEGSDDNRDGIYQLNIDDLPVGGYFFKVAKNLVSFLCTFLILLKTGRYSSS